MPFLSAFDVTTNPPVQLVVVLLSAVVVLIPIFTFLFACIFNQYVASRDHSTSPPPMLPYYTPWIGHTFVFLATKPGSFWRKLLRRFGSDVPACSIVLLGKRMSVLLSQDATQALFKVRRREVGHDVFQRQMAVGPLGVSPEDNDLFWNYDDDPKNKSVHDHLSSTTSVNALTEIFRHHFQQQLDTAPDDWRVVNLLSWLRGHMFQASTITMLGTRLLEMNPDFPRQYWIFDEGYMDLLFLRPFPRFIRRSLYQNRDELLDQTAHWIETMVEEAGPVSDDGPEWEPRFGSRAVRANHRLYQQCGIGIRGQAGFDLGFLFGLSSNAIRSACWLLHHILVSSDPTLLPSLLTELHTTQTTSGKIDKHTLLQLPLLNSAFHETLRLYVDFLVVRELATDLPVGSVILPPGEVIAPTWTAHRDTTFWNHTNPNTDDLAVPVDQWHARRFLRHDPETRKDTFSTAGTTGRFFPFGGGTYQCPGRSFAKHEVFGAVASVLLQFEFEAICLVQADGKKSSTRDVSEGVGVRSGFGGGGISGWEGDVRVRMRRRRMNAESPVW